MSPALIASISAIPKSFPLQACSKMLDFLRTSFFLVQWHLRETSHF
jgi:hypothetical protein